MTTIKLDEIKITDRLQPRLQMDMLTVAEYTNEMQNGRVFPPLEVVAENGHYWLWDGYHRKQAAENCGFDTIEANVQEGTLEDAEWLALSANIRHGLRRTNADKRRAVELAFKHPRAIKEFETWQKINFSFIGKHCGVDHKFAANIWYEINPKKEVSTKVESWDNPNFQEDLKVLCKKSDKTTTKPPIGEGITPELQQTLLNTAFAEDKKDVEVLGKLEPELQEKVAEKIITGEAKTVKAAKQKVAREEKYTNKVEPGEITGLYSVIYADPPWEYKNSGFYGAAADHYPTMPTKEICGLPIKEKTTDDAVLFLWVTNPHLPDGLKVMKAWGFEYKTNFVWIKDKSTYGKLGFYNYGRHELLLVGTKGSMLPYPEELKESVIEAKKGEHSRKPDLYELIEYLYPNQSYLEMFSRQIKDGWANYGNERLNVS